LSKERSGIQMFFSTTPYAALPSLGTLLWKAVQHAIFENRIIIFYCKMKSDLKGGRGI
jgi:hypothetical protein